MLPCSSSVARAAEWKPLAQSLITEQKPGYGGLCGVLVERTSGDVYLNVSDRGLFRSTDQGANWKRVGEEFKGRTETPGCMLFDPTGKSKRMLIALVYGGPIILAPELSSTWSTLDKKVNHVDWAAIDWVDPQPKFVLTLKHESGGDLLASHDGGKSFSEVAKGYGPGWVFDATTAVVAQAKSRDKASGGLVRTTDGGKTFSACGEYSARANPRLYDGTLYWLTENSLIATTDQGQTWKKLSDVKGGLYGPVFGHTAKQMFLVTSAGVVESTDGGATWGTAIALPKEMKGASVMTWLDYDPKHDLLYTVKMSSDLYSLEHK
jgi:photosystem II stability/assembly factor-like uncharacterized protein